MSTGLIIFCIAAIQIGISIFALGMLYQTSEKVIGIKTDVELLKLAKMELTNESDYNVKIGAHSYDKPPLTTSLINNFNQTLENTNNRIEEISNGLKEVNTKFNNVHSTVLHQQLSPHPKTFSGLVKQLTEIQRNKEQKQKAEPYSRMESHPKKRIYQIQGKKTSPDTHYACGMRRPINYYDCLEIRSRAERGQSREFICTEMGFARSTFYKALRKAYPEGIPLNLQK